MSEARIEASKIEEVTLKDCNCAYQHDPYKAPEQHSVLCPFFGTAYPEVHAKALASNAPTEEESQLGDICASCIHQFFSHTETGECSAYGCKCTKFKPVADSIGEPHPGWIYVASRASLPERSTMWREYRAAGAPIISTWIDESGPGETDDLGELWTRICSEIVRSVALVVYIEGDDFPLKGTLVEVGMALALGKRVFLVLKDVKLEERSMRPVGSWMNHPLVTVSLSVSQALVDAGSVASKPLPAQPEGRRCVVPEKIDLEEMYFDEDGAPTEHGRIIDAVMDAYFIAACEHLGRDSNDSYQMVYEGEDGLDTAIGSMVGGIIAYAQEPHAFDEQAERGKFEAWWDTQSPNPDRRETAFSAWQARAVQGEAK